MQSLELTVIQRAAVALGTTERETALRNLVVESKSIVEIKDNAGREQCHGALMRLRATRTDIQRTGKAAREDAQRRAAVEAEERRLAEQRAEQDHRQAELDRAERERQEREAAEAREKAVAARLAEAGRREREARLIDAAPDLLDFALSVRDHDDACRKNGFPILPPDMRDALDAVLEKALGEAAIPEGA